ncbi:hypothetical protein NL676_016491 [Syzygium grande]|nr:hypothetical protein NL676_016491 [Syzygium grande]
MWTVDSPVQSCGEEGHASKESVEKRYKEALGVGPAGGREEFDCITHPPSTTRTVVPSSQRRGSARSLQ